MPDKTPPPARRQTKQGASSSQTEAAPRAPAEADLARFRAVMDQADEAIFIRDVADSDRLDVNETACRWLGYTREELLRLEPQGFVVEYPWSTKESLEAFIELLRRAEGRGIPRELSFQRKDGSCFPVEASISLVRFEDRECFISVAKDITERKQAEEALRRERDFSRSVLASLSAQIAVLDGEGNITMVNDAWKRLADEKGADPLTRNGVGVNYLELCRQAEGRFSEGAREVAEGIQAVLEGSGDQFTREYLCPSGPIPRWFLVSVSPLRTRAGGAVISHVDITAQKLAEAERHDSEKRLREQLEEAEHLYNTVPVGLSFVDEEFRFVRISDRLAAWNGKPISEHIGRKPSDVIPELAQVLEPIYTRVIETGEPVIDLEYHGPAPSDPSVDRDWLVSYYPLKRSDQTVRGVHAVVQEITQRKQAEQALRESEEKWRSLVETAPDFVTLLDREGTVLYVNRTLPEHQLEDVVGKKAYGFIFPEDQEIFRECLKTVLDRGEPATCEVRAQRPNGISWYTLRFAAVRKADVVTAVTVIATDITERKHLEEQLRHSQKMEAVGRLAGGLAHDFNNLLTVISAYCDLILEDLDNDSPIRGEIEEIRIAGERAADLTNQLLVFSRQQASKPRRISLNTVTAETQKMLKRLLGEDIELITRLDSSLGSVMADPGQIQQILLNLAVNSRDAMPHGGTLTIETTEVDFNEDQACKNDMRPGRYVKLSLRDTGAGMDEQTKSRIFEPFFTTKEPGRGTGLGLSVVYGIVRQSGGYTRVESEPGKGTSFQMCFPRVEGGPEASKLPRSSASQFSGTETVLLVEDDRAVRDLAQRVLEEAGYRVLAAYDGREALQIVSEKEDRPIDLLLSDLVMPGMRGQELADRVAARYPQMRVLYMSGYANKPIPEGPFLKKPFSAVGLLKKVRESLDAPLRPSKS